MRKLYKANEKATVCAKGSCVTVYGDTARLINALAVAAALIVVVAYIDKALR